MELDFDYSGNLDFHIPFLYFNTKLVGNRVSNITTFNDVIIDSDSDGDNDTITFTLTTDYATPANYTARIFFEDENIPILSDTRIISSGNPSFYMDLSTFYLKESINTYFVRIYNQIGQVVYESSKKNTGNYTNYESGTNIISISNQNVNNNFIRVNLTLNVTRNETVNISVSLNYNESTITSTKEVSLTTPSQVVSVDFDNETIKSTHYDGIYSVENVKIGDKIINEDYNTSSYDYETFENIPNYLNNLNINFSVTTYSEAYCEAYLYNYDKDGTNIPLMSTGEENISGIGSKFSMYYLGLDDGEYHLNVSCVDQFLGNSISQLTTIKLQGDTRIFDASPRFKVFKDDSLDIELKTHNNGTCYYMLRDNIWDDQDYGEIKADYNGFKPIPIDELYKLKLDKMSSKAALTAKDMNVSLTKEMDDFMNNEETGLTAVEKRIKNLNESAAQTINKTINVTYNYSSNRNNSINESIPQ